MVFSKFSIVISKSRVVFSKFSMVISKLRVVFSKFNTVISKLRIVFSKFSMVISKLWGQINYFSIKNKPPDLPGGFIIIWKCNYLETWNLPESTTLPFLSFNWKM